MAESPAAIRVRRRFGLPAERVFDAWLDPAACRPPGNRPQVATHVTVPITPRKAGCELTLTHTGLPPDLADQTEARWTGILYGLGMTLASNERIEEQS